jgi:hypothetical protein
MAEKLHDRIARRTAIADEQYEQQGLFGRMFNRAGLHTANFVDRVISPINSGPFAFIGGAAEGVLQGGIVGGTIGLVMLGLGLIPAITAGAPTALLIAGTAAVLSALYHGKKALVYHEAHADDERLADRIAEKSGAVPEGARSMPAPEHAHKQETLPVTAQSDKSPLDKSPPAPNFVLQQEIRRERSPHHHNDR